MLYDALISLPLLETQRLLALALVVISIYVVQRRRQWNLRRGGRPLPPGPKGLPIIGNALDIPTKFEWEVYDKWAKEYDSEIVHAGALGFSIAVLSSRKAAIEILDHKSAVTSARFVPTHPTQSMGWDFILPLIQIGDKYRDMRKLFQQHFHDATRYRVGVKESLPQMLSSLVDNPEDFRYINRFFIMSTVYKFTYGVRDKAKVDYYSKMLQDVAERSAQAVIPGAFLVDIFPFLKYVPEWAPGAGFKRVARESFELGLRFADEPLNEALNEMNLGNGETCFVSTAHSNAERDGVVDEQSLRLIRDVGASVTTAGTDTILSTLDYFYYTMSVHPKVQQLAQKELDDYLKGDRLPTLDDEPNLPYITALVREVVRGKHIIPFLLAGVAHLSTEDLVYNGYFIPRNTFIIPNQWAMLRDENDFPQPEMFKPERHLTSEGKLNSSVVNPESIAFGFGRRICPGSHLAMSTLFVAISSVLTLFTIEKVEEFDPDRQIRLGVSR
ncbi:cytochrome P450 [Coprinopsis marcescibilis]|uniref:Cytochrome P450 n=1 Tax=Coprinopsis marcescibilis TaxID=230819 RepID=A0A5C3KHE3_COPMA|nr:cytochrome P450 [Coprinopsis marcescibilis]